MCQSRAAGYVPVRDVLKSTLISFRSHGGAFVISGASQAISSLTNFGVLLYLIRALSKEQFGLYGLSFAILLALAGLLSALYAVQLVVNLPDQPENGRRIYAMEHTATLTATGLGAVILALLAGEVSPLLTKADVPMLSLTLPIAFSATAFATRDILIRIAYIENRGWVVLLANSVVMVAVSIVFTLASISDNGITAQHAVYVYGIGQLAGIPPLLAALQLPWRKLTTSGVKSAISHSWAGGRWHVMTNLVYSVRTQTHNFVIAPLIGLAALAEVNSARVLLTPAVMLMPPIYQIMMPRLAERRASGVSSVSRMTSRITVVLACAAAVYSIVLLYFLDWIGPFVLTSEYGNVREAIVAWSVVTVLMAVRNSLTMAQEAMKSFRDLFIINFLTAIAAVGISVLLAKHFGGVGAIWALASTELLLAILLVRSIYGRASNTIRSEPA